MKKLIVIFLSAIIVIFISYSKTDNHIKANKVYTKDIDLAQDNNNITIDNTRMMERSKEILNDIYGIGDFSDYRTQYDFADYNVFYVYFFDKDNNGYFISYNVDKGILIALSKITDVEPVREGEGKGKSLDELKEMIMGYLKKLEVSDSDNYEISSYDYYGNYLDVRLTNKLTQNEIRISVGIYTGELDNFDFSSAYTLNWLRW